MIPPPDWSDPAAVKRYKRKIIRRDLLRFGLLPILIGLLPAAGFTVYRRYYPLSEQERLRRRERRKANLDRPVTKRGLLLVIVAICGLGSMAMAILLMLRPL